MRERVHALDVDDAHDVVDDSDLEFLVLFGVGSHGGAAVDFEKPGLAVGVEDEVEAVEFEGVGAVGD